MQRIIRDYYEQLHANKLDSLEKKYIFINIQPTKTELWQSRKLNRPMCKKSESLIISFLSKKIPGSDGFTAKFYQTFK